MQALFYKEIGKLTDPESHESRIAANFLNIKQADVPAIIRARMDPKLSSFHDIITLFADYEREKTFAESIRVNAEKWVTFVKWIKTRVDELYAQQLHAQQLHEQQLHELQQQQLQQQQPHQQPLTSEEHAQLQQQIRSRLDNWERMRQKLNNCEDPHTIMLSQMLGVNCDHFISILTYLGQEFTNILFIDETLDVEQQRQVATHLGVDPDKWINVIRYLHQVLRIPFIQPDASHENQNYSRALEPSPSPHRLGGKKSRSKKRGLHRRKSIHRRKKSSHKKRK